MLISRYPPNQGGMEIQCQRLSQALAARGHSVTVLTERTSSELPPLSQDQGVQVIRYGTLLSPPGSSILFCLRALAYLLRHRAFDLYHAHMLALPAIFALRIGRLLKKPVVVKAAGAGSTGDLGTTQRLWYGGLKLREFKNQARYVVCPSEQLVNEFRQFGLPDKALRCIPNGVDTQAYQPPATDERRAIRERLGLPAQRRLAIYAGRWVPGKGVDKLLDAWEKGLQGAGFEWDLVLLLADARQAAQNAEARLRSLGGHVHLFHNVSDPAPYYRASDLAVLLSDAEGLSNFLLEAMACGLAAITTNPAAITRQSERDAWSWIAGRAAPIVDDVVRQLRLLQQDPEALTNKGAAARRKVENEFGIDRVAAAYETLYHEMTGPSKI